MTAVTARAPGKLIISGEHAVVHGHPALAIAVKRYADTTVHSQSPASVLFDLVNLPHKRQRTMQALRRIKNRVQSSYEKFQSGEKGIRDVLKKPFELLEYTTSNVLEKLSPHHSQGFSIHTHSTIPTGCGMGSSAATIISTNFALAHYLQKSISPENLLQLGLAAENMQHGKSSGLDLYMSIHGGCQLFQNGKAQSRPIPQLPLYMINTGAPISATGECVKHAAQFFTHSAIGKQFAQLTLAIDAAIQANDMDSLLTHIKANHQLLCQIEVVPKAIQNLIAQCETLGFAAKICGAGAVKGDKAGMVLLVGHGDIETINNRIAYPIERIEPCAQGVMLL